MATFDKFDGYEVRQVVEYEGYCEPIGNGIDLEVARAAEDYKADFWTLYGHVIGRGVIAIGDFKREADAMEILERIGGALIA